MRPSPSVHTEADQLVASYPASTQALITAARASLIGADRGRIITQLLTESVLLAVVGGALGLLCGLVGIRALLSIITAGLPRLGASGSFVNLDWRLSPLPAWWRSGPACCSASCRRFTHRAPI